MRQLHFAMLDLELHARFKPGGKETIFDVDHRIAEKTMVMPPLPEDRYCSGPLHALHQLTCLVQPQPEHFCASACPVQSLCMLAPLHYFLSALCPLLLACLSH